MSTRFSKIRPQAPAISQSPMTDYSSRERRIRYVWLGLIILTVIMAGRFVQTTPDIMNVSPKLLGFICVSDLIGIIFMRSFFKKLESFTFKFDAIVGLVIVGCLAFGFLFWEFMSVTYVSSAEVAEAFVSTAYLAAALLSFATIVLTMFSRHFESLFIGSEPKSSDTSEQLSSADNSD